MEEAWCPSRAPKQLLSLTLLFFNLQIPLRQKSCLFSLYFLLKTHNYHIRNRKKVKFPRTVVPSSSAVTLEGRAPGVECVGARAAASHPECRRQRPAHGNSPPPMPAPSSWPPGPGASRAAARLLHGQLQGTLAPDSEGGGMYKTHLHVT